MPIASLRARPDAVVGVAMRLTRAVVAGAILTAGCAGAGWSRPDVTTAELARDDDQCRGEASYSSIAAVGRGGGRLGRVYLNVHTYRRCMEAKGYEWRR